MTVTPALFYIWKHQFIKWRGGGGQETDKCLISKMQAYSKRITIWDLIYIYDVIIYSDTVQSRLKQYDSVFTRLREAGRKFKQFKCALINPSVLYLGHVVNKDGLHPNPIIVDNVLRCKTPWKRERDTTVLKDGTYILLLPFLLIIAVLRQSASWLSNVSSLTSN